MNETGGGVLFIVQEGFEGDGRLLGSLELSDGGHGEAGVTVVFRRERFYR